MLPGSLNSKRWLSDYSSQWVLAGLSVAVLLIFAPILPGNFLSDDHTYIGHLLEYGWKYVQGQDLDSWFFGYNGSAFLRPLVQWLWIFNYIAWNVNATGYYLTNLLLHVLNSFLVYLLVWQVVRNRAGAVVGAILFAFHPARPESVAWIADCVDLLATFFCLLSAVFFVLYRRRGKTLWYIVSLIAFALAILTKESALALPAVLFTYDALFTYRKLGWKTARAQAVFWLMLPGYAALRYVVFRGFGFSSFGLAPYGWEWFLQYYVGLLGKPFLPEMNSTLLQVSLALVAVLIVVFRSNPGLWLGLAWLAGYLVITSTVHLHGRLVYLPAVGLAVAEAAILEQLAGARFGYARGVAAVVFLSVAGMYSISLYSRVNDYAAAGAVAAAVPRGLRQLHSSVPEGSKLYFVGIPEILRMVDIYGGNFAFAMRNAYPGNPYFQAYTWSKFPILNDGLDRVYFFEYRGRQVRERQDLVDALRERKRCLGNSSLAYEWTFTSDTQGWEPWNQLTQLRIREGMLSSSSEGSDPFMGSPTVDIPSGNIGAVEIDMRVESDKLAMQGDVFWLLAGMEDFSPAFRVPVEIQADGGFHTYRADISGSGKLSMGDRIVQLRVDPADAPADIAIRSIRVYSHCLVKENAR